MFVWRILSRSPKHALTLIVTAGHYVTTVRNLPKLRPRHRQRNGRIDTDKTGATDTIGANDIGRSKEEAGEGGAEREGGQTAAATAAAAADKGQVLAGDLRDEGQQRDDDEEEDDEDDDGCGAAPIEPPMDESGESSWYCFNDNEASRLFLFP